MRERLRVLRHHDFRYLWLAQSTSAMGDGVVIVALALFVTDLTDNPTEVGIVLGAQMLPLVSFLLIGGVWADRLPRARLMLGCDIARAVLHSLLAILIFTDAVEIWHLVVIEALFGVAMAFSIPAYNGLVPRTVPPDEVQDAQALSGFTFNLAELTGPAIATALVLGLGAGWAFLLDAATFVASALMLARVRTSGVPPDAYDRWTHARERPHAHARAHLRRASRRGRPADAARGARGGLPRGALARLAVGHRRGVRAGGAARLRTAVRARADRGGGDLQRARRLRRGHRRVRRRSARGRADRIPLAARAPHARRVLVIVGGAILTAAVLSLGLLPRETRTLRRVEHGSRV